MATQQHSFANPAPAGLGALAMACFTFYAMFTGKVSHDALPLLACWLVGGAICQLTCGIIELKDHNISGGNVFLFFGAFFMATAALACATKYGLLKAGLPFDTKIEGWAWCASAAWLTLMTPSYLKSTKALFWAVVLIDVALWSIVIIDLQLGNKAIFAPIVAWTLLIAGCIGLYLAGAITLNTVFERSIFPVPAPHISPTASVKLQTAAE